MMKNIGVLNKQATYKMFSMLWKLC